VKKGPLECAPQHRIPTAWLFEKTFHGAAFSAILHYQVAEIFLVKMAPASLVRRKGRKKVKNDLKKAQNQSKSGWFQNCGIRYEKVDPPGPREPF
jgi:hypothetical protein